MGMIPEKSLEAAHFATK